MPINHRIIEQRIQKCDKKLRELFADQTSNTLKLKVKKVTGYYNFSYIKATSVQTAEEIVTRYESFVDQLTQVKHGEMDSETVLNQVKRSLSSRNDYVIIHNITKACELIFWTAATSSLYAGVFGIALPVLIVQPVLGIAVGITFLGALFTAGYKALSCLDEFKSSSRHDIEYTHEASLVSFFNKCPLQEQQEIEGTDEDLVCCI